jgi:amidase
MTSSTTEPSWQAATATKRAECLSKIPKGWMLPSSLLDKYDLGPTSGTDVVSLDIPRVSGLLSPTELAITEDYTATELIQEITKRRFTSVEVTLAFSKRATIAHQLVGDIISYSQVEAKTADFQR